ncbi:MAG: sulfite exporter TauE/SafE family protein [Alphaproteobacteria bacterium]|nr:sulfite exporter TauE/SafE family protein [Alphaproteobacteria bacterium]
MDYSLLLTALGLGLLSSLHCMGMCGGIAGALTLSLPPEKRDDKSILAWYAFAYNLGRILTYGIAGALAGALGSGLLFVLGPTNGLYILRFLASVFLLFVGLYMAGWLPSYASIEHMGRGLWQKVQPLSQTFLPAKSPLQALLYGLFWGWMPCSLVYTSLIWATASGGMIEGLLTMIMFGLGTLPIMVATSFFAGTLLGRLKSPQLRQKIGIFIIVLGVLSLIYAGQLADSLCQTCGLK